jgi:hypothetical protein
MKIHENKKYACIKCDRTFTRSATLNSHLKTHDVVNNGETSQADFNGEIINNLDDDEEAEEADIVEDEEEADVEEDDDEELSEADNEVENETKNKNENEIQKIFDTEVIKKIESEMNNAINEFTTNQVTNNIQNQATNVQRETKAQVGENVENLDFPKTEMQF